MNAVTTTLAILSVKTHSCGIDIAVVVSHEPVNVQHDELAPSQFSAGQGTSVGRNKFGFRVAAFGVIVKDVRCETEKDHDIHTNDTRKRIMTYSRMLNDTETAKQRLTRRRN